MIVAAIKNHPTEELGYIEEVFERRGVEYYYVEAYERQEIGDFDALVILGGPMGVYESDKYPFLKWEMDLIAENYRERPILGICLGAQLAAAALGARVYPYIREIGWRKVRRVADVPLPEEIEVFQWHKDTFDLPTGAKLIYAGDVVRNQCFVAGKILALQFHVEMTLDMIGEWVSKSKMSEEEKEKIISESEGKIEEHNRLCEMFIDAWLGGQIF